MRIGIDLGGTKIWVRPPGFTSVQGWKKFSLNTGS
jgi:hypothetical protein